MHKILSGIMTLLMLTPVLTCAMPFCPIKAAQARTEAAAHQTQPPCHQMGIDSRTASQTDQKTEIKDGPMLALDCMGIDLFHTSVQADIAGPDLTIDMIHFVWADRAGEYHDEPVATQTIRGPPPDGTQPLFHSSSLVLTTQRFRI